MTPVTPQAKIHAVLSSGDWFTREQLRIAVQLPEADVNRYLRQARVERSVKVSKQPQRYRLKIRPENP